MGRRGKGECFNSGKVKERVVVVVMGEGRKERERVVEVWRKDSKRRWEAVVAGGDWIRVVRQKTVEEEEGGGGVLVGMNHRRRVRGKK